jgi:hypothetical protein
MSYRPPRENLPIFDSSLFNDANTTIPDVSDTYLTFPVAQGAETLKDTTVDGDLLVLGTTTIDSLILEDINCTEINASGDIICNAITAQYQGLSITGEQIQCQRIDAFEYVSTDTLRYTNLEPPISGVAEPISKVLQNGNDAENETLINLGGLTMTGNLNVNFNQITNWANGTVTGHLYAASGNPLGTDTRAEFGVFNNDGNNGYIMGIGDVTGTLNEYNTFKIADNATGTQYLRIDNASTQQITLSSDKLLYKIDYTNPASGTSYILNSINNPPMYKQIFSNVYNIINLKSITSSVPYWLWASKVYEGDSVFNYGVNYGELLLSFFSITITSPTPWVGTNNCQLYLGNSLNSIFDPDLGNRITFNCVNNPNNGEAEFTFVSTIPIILYFQNGESGNSFNTLYFLAQFQDSGIYSFQFNNCNFMTTGTISGKNTGALAIND